MWHICIDCIQLWAVVVSKLLCETIMVIFPTTIQRAITENIVQFSGLGLSQMDMSRTIGVSQGVTGSWEQQFYTGATWASSEDSYIKRRMYPSTHLEAEEFPLNWPESGCSWSGELGALSLSVWSKGVFTHYECNKSFYIITNVENYFVIYVFAGFRSELFPWYVRSQWGIGPSNRCRLVFIWLGNSVFHETYYFWCTVVFW